MSKNTRSIKNHSKQLINCYFDTSSDDNVSSDCNISNLSIETIETDSGAKDFARASSALGGSTEDAGNLNVDFGNNATTSQFIIKQVS